MRVSASNKDAFRKSIKQEASLTMIRMLRLQPSQPHFNVVNRTA